MGDPSGDVPFTLRHRKHSTVIQRDFVSQVPEYHRKRSSSLAQPQPDGLDIGTSLSEFWVGIAIQAESTTSFNAGIAVHDGTYSVDFCIHRISMKEDNPENGTDWIADHFITELHQYRKDHLCKLLGAGVTLDLHRKAPTLCARLWAELDIVPIVLESTPLLPIKQAHRTKGINVDELADSAARKCLTFFGPTKQPRLSISYQNQVEVDLAGMIRLATLDEYEKSVRPPTWRAVQKHIKDVKDRNLRIAFFSATPQGGGVALMRHALLRFLTEEGVHVEWFVPKPRPDVFRITKTNHNILQGAVPPEVRATDESLGKIKEWIKDNAERFWLSDDGGPLKAPSEGGADVIIVDDPQMPELIPIAKREAPDRPVIFRCHIEVRDDLVLEDGSAAQHVWQNMWSSIKQADVFLSHPVRSFVPPDVRRETLGWLPATTDWLDGLNKSMDNWDLSYYMHVLRQTCQGQGLPQMQYPNRGFFTQIARFDPSKGIPDVLKSYARFRELMGDEPKRNVHQLVICGHSSIDDPDGSMIYDQTMDTIHQHYPDLVDDIIVIRLGPSDQILNAVMSLCTVAMQLSTREGFEVKVSEALHKGKPIIATLAGGIPLQVEHGKSGFLVERGDHEAVAKHLYNLVMDGDLYDRMSEYASTHVSDEVHTVGNALSWMFLASSMAGGKTLKPNERWINDLAREAAGEPYLDGEPHLPRHLST
ncbi:hypothetical protein LTR72_002016 [Exophiala xenobiotica]|nr:hypothetical protein LTR41_007049 [Exophiala xenobiotica]KAK5228133.1 hypothetical protein LTR72_002016 [Exophiala xenobiotica]KAK5464041.1 hypothetical protein LTR20_004747 [Exophiala xenobiotica]KAK5497802.1 hypothetical protein LTR26_001202 [Exophiala xenobiotica]